MRIAYDGISMKATVSFRGRISVIAGTYSTQKEAIDAGEMHCRKLGWQPAKSIPAVSMMMRRR